MICFYIIATLNSRGESDLKKNYQYRVNQSEGCLYFKTTLAFKKINQIIINTPDFGQDLKRRHYFANLFEFEEGENTHFYLSQS